jgi:predicted MFS family arabinose efflux permease
MPSARTSAAGSVLRVLGRPQVPLGMLAVALFFMGQFALYTYVRPFLETATRVDVSTLSLILLANGGAGLLGTYLIGLLLKTRLYGLLIVMPLVMAAIAAALTLFGGSPIIVPILLAGWGARRHGCARRLVDLAKQGAPGRCRSGRRAHGSRDPAGDHGRRPAAGFYLTAVVIRRLSHSVPRSCAFLPSPLSSHRAL